MKNLRLQIWIAKSLTLNEISMQIEAFPLCFKFKVQSFNGVNKRDLESHIIITPFWISLPFLRFAKYSITVIVAVNLNFLYTVTLTHSSVQNKPILFHVSSMKLTLNWHWNWTKSKRTLNPIISEWWRWGITVTDFVGANLRIKANNTVIMKCQPVLCILRWNILINWPILFPFGGEFARHSSSSYNFPIFLAFWFALIFQPNRDSCDLLLLAVGLVALVLIISVGRQPCRVDRPLCSLHSRCPHHQLCLLLLVTWNAKSELGISINLQTRRRQTLDRYKVNWN